jgi:hypothetical protein
MGEVTQILQAIEHGDGRAIDQLLPAVYQELRQLAAQKLSREKPGQTLVTDRVKPSHRGSGQNQPVFLVISYTFCLCNASAFRGVVVPDFATEASPDRSDRRPEREWAVARARRSLAAAGRAGWAGRTGRTL